MNGLEGVRISKDPEAFITALTQLDRLNMMPEELDTLDENVVTHPSTRKRIAAIARVSNLSPDHVSDLVASVRSRETVEGYELPAVVEAAAAGTSPLFNSTLKRQISLRFTFAYMFVLGGMPVLCLHLASLWPNAATQWAAYVGGALLSVATVLLVLDCAGGKLQVRLGPKLRARLLSTSKGPPPEPVFVGVGPHSEPRLYEGCHNWDLGFLEIQTGRLRYTGEQTTFALLPRQISKIQLGHGPPRWLKTNRIYIEWVDSGASAAGHLSFCCAGSRSLWVASRANTQLIDRLQTWLTQPEASHTSGNDAGEQSAPLPPTATVTSKSPYEPESSFQFLLSLALGAFLAFMISSMLTEGKWNLTTRLFAAAWAAGLHMMANVPAWRGCRKSIGS